MKKKDYKKRFANDIKVFTKKKKWQYGREQCKNLPEDELSIEKNITKQKKNSLLQLVWYAT